MAKPRDHSNLVSNTITFADISNNRLGVLKSNPATTLDVNGDITGGQVLASGQVTMTNLPYLRNVKTIAANYTVQTTYNEASVGPITINSGITVTIVSGGTWCIL
jgi:hypothetical protein